MRIIFTLCIVVTLGLLFVYRPITSWLLGRQQVRQSWWLYVACGLFCLSWWLPSPLIHGQDMSTVTHIVGGGMFCGALWLDLKVRYGLTWVWPKQAVLLLALVSVLGVANELFELAGVELKFLRIPLNDTNYDLLANTLGALLVFVAYYGYRLVAKAAKK